MPRRKIWQTSPTLSDVLDIISQRKAITDHRLYELLRSKDPNFGYDDLIKTLFKLEVLGHINVRRYKRPDGVEELLITKLEKQQTFLDED